MVSSVAWSAAAKWSAQVASWASTIVVARLLSASDYGIMGMAAVFLGVVALLSEMGVGSSVLILRDLTREQIAQLNTLALLMGVGGYLLTLLAAEPLGALFNSADLPAVLRVLGLTFIIGSFRSVPLALLQRQLRFKRTAAIDAISNVASAGTVVTLALLDFGYWALAIGQMMTMVASSIMLLKSCPHPFARPRWESLRRAMTFSNRVIVGRLSWYTYSNADFFVAGRVLGATGLGIYSFGWSLTNMALDKVGTLINAVTPAFFSAVQQDSTGIRRMLLGVTEVLALIVIPATVGAALVARDLIPVVFGAKWAGAIPVVQLLALYGVLRAVSPVLSNVLLNAGQERFLMWTSVANAVCFPVAFLVGASYGPVGIAAAWSLLYPLSMFVMYWRIFQLRIVTPREYLGAVVPAFQATLVMLVLVLLVQRMALAEAPAAVRLTVAVLAGITAYALALWVGHRDRCMRVVRLVRQRRTR